MNVPLLTNFELILSEDGAHLILRMNSNDGTSYLTGINSDAIGKVSTALQDAGKRLESNKAVPAKPLAAKAEPVARSKANRRAGRRK